MVTLTLWLALSVGAAGPAPAPQARIVVTLEPDDRRDVGSPVTVSAVCHAPGAEAALAIDAVTSTAPGTATFAVPAGSTCRVTCSAAGFWCEQRTTAMTGPESQVQVRLWPTGRVAGRIQMPAREPLPAATLVSFMLLPGEQGPEGDVRCPVVEDARWTCEVPSGTRNLRVRSEGFVSHFFWARQVSRTAVLDLGTMQLERGASLVGWVERDDGKAIAPGTRVEIEPAASQAPLGPQDKSRAGAMVAPVPVDQKGFFHVTGVRPGTVRVAAKAGGGASSRPVAVTLIDNQEVRLRDSLVLSLPVSIDLVVDPPVGPTEEAWRVELIDADVGRSISALVAAKPCATDGSVSIAGLRPGTYWLRVLDARRQKWWAGEVEAVRDGPPVYVQVELVRVRGLVTLGDDGIAASIWFGGQHGAKQVQLASDEDGRFEGILPSSGAWEVDVVAEAAGVRRTFDAVDVRPAGKDRVAEVKLVVPDTRLEGLAVDADGRGTKALITCKGLTGQGGNAYLRSEADGTFVLRGLDAGTVMLNAATAAGESDWAVIAIEEGSTPPRVVLRLQPRRELRGRVVSGSSGVAAAKVHAYAAQGGVAYPTWSAQTDVDGRFALKVRPGHLVPVVIEAPGFARRTLLLTADSEKELAIPVEQSSGTLVVQAAEPLDELVVVHNGFFEAFLMFAAWGERNGGSGPRPGGTEMPGLEAGDYKVCRLTSVAQAAGSAPIPEAACAGGFLAVGGRLQLKLMGPS